MEKQTEIKAVLDALALPAFTAEDGAVSQVNTAARGLLIQPGTPIHALLHTGREEYASFSQGRLYLTLELAGTCHKASVCRLENTELFILEQEDQRELTALALAARELREPLSRAILSAERLFGASPEEEALRLNRGLYQMLRILGNMSDAGSPASRQETVDIPAVIEEVFEKAAALVPHAGITLRYQGIQESVYALADPQLLERAILNTLSNSMKFTPKGGTIDAILARRERMLQLTIWDSGSGIAEELLPTLFTRYLRQPTIEDSRCGLGLGMTLIKSAAEAHGGTVLIDKPASGGARITLTLAIRQRTEDTLRSPILRVDRFGERDHALIELSDSLPPELYDTF